MDFGNNKLDIVLLREHDSTTVGGRIVSCYRARVSDSIDACGVVVVIGFRFRVKRRSYSVFAKMFTFFLFSSNAFSDRNTSRKVVFSIIIDLVFPTKTTENRGKNCEHVKL